MVVSMQSQLCWSAPSAGELVIILLVVVILFGGKKIPELARGIGKGIREFNDAKEGVRNEIESGMKNSEKKESETK